MTVNDAPEELAQQALAGPHSGWSFFDIRLEGARFHKLHAVVSALPFDRSGAEKILAELTELAETSGYGTMDSYMTDATGGASSPEQEILFEAMHHSLHQGIGDSEYFSQVSSSVSILDAASATDEAKEFVVGIDEALTAAFIAGRDSRAAVDNPTP